MSSAYSYAVDILIFDKVIEDENDKYTRTATVGDKDGILVGFGEGDLVGLAVGEIVEDLIVGVKEGRNVGWHDG
jgi:hypothetical protein